MFIQGTSVSTTCSLKKKTQVKSCKPTSKEIDDLDRFTIDFNLAYDSLAESSCLVVHMPSPVDITRYTPRRLGIYPNHNETFVCALVDMCTC